MLGLPSFPPSSSFCLSAFFPLLASLHFFFFLILSLSASFSCFLPNHVTFYLSSIHQSPLPVLSSSSLSLSFMYIWFLSWLLLLLFAIDLSHWSASFFCSFFPSLSVWTPTHCKSVWSSQCLSFSLFLNSLSHKLQNHFSGSYFSLSGLFFWVLTRFSTPLPAYLHCSLFASHQCGRQVAVRERKTGSLTQEWQTPILYSVHFLPYKHEDTDAH